MKKRMSVVVNSLYISNAGYTSQVELVYSSLRRYFKVDFVDVHEEADDFGSISVDERIRLFNVASNNSDFILSYAGGFNSIELLSRFKELRIYPNTVFIGSSDGTILANALLGHGANASIYGPDFMKMVFDVDYVDKMAASINYAVNGDYAQLSKCLSTDEAIVMNKGDVKNVRIYGGNNYTFDLLQGTEFMPNLDQPFVLLLEGEYTGTISEEEVFPDFIRNIDSLLLQPGVKQNLKALIVGKFPGNIMVRKSLFRKFLDARPVLKDLPCIYDVPIGHSKGALSIPLGVMLDIGLDSKDKITLKTPGKV